MEKKTEKQAEKQAEKVAQKSKVNTIKVVPPYGRFVNYHTGQVIDGETEVEVDGFIQSQLDAGILVKV